MQHPMYVMLLFYKSLFWNTFLMDLQVEILYLVWKCQAVKGGQVSLQEFQTGMNALEYVGILKNLR